MNINDILQILILVACVFFGVSAFTAIVWFVWRQEGNANRRIAEAETMKKYVMCNKAAQMTGRTQSPLQKMRAQMIAKTTEPKPLRIEDVGIIEFINQ